MAIRAGLAGASSGSRAGPARVRAYGRRPVNASILSCGLAPAGTSPAAAIIFWPSGLVPRSRAGGTWWRPIVVTSTVSGGSVSSAPIERARSQLWISRSPIRNPASSCFGIPPKSATLPVSPGGGVRADQAAALGLPAKGVLHELANGPLVTWRRPIPLAVGDLAVNLAPLGCGLTPQIQRSTHLVPPPSSPDGAWQPPGR